MKKVVKAKVSNSNKNKELKQEKQDSSCSCGCGCSCCETLKKLPCGVKLICVILIIALIHCLLNFICPFCKNNVSNKKIGDWIRENPKAIIESVQKFAQEEQERYQKEQQEKAGENIVKFSKELKNTSNAPVLNKKGTKELVEFFDYNCGYCKIAYKSVKELLEKRKDVKVILRPIAILGDGSKYATRIGYAVLKMDEDKYIKYYNALMEGSARSKEDVEKALKSADLKLSKVEKYLEENSSSIDKLVNDNYELAGKIGVNGTPAFVVNGELIPGAVDADTLSNKLK